MSLILLGSILLVLPIAWNGDGRLSFLDAVFTATSAVCVTGLITVQTADYSIWGKIVILLLIQFGGLGIISFTTIYLAVPARKISLKRRNEVQEYYLSSVETDPKKIIKQIVVFTVISEIIGTVLLAKPFSANVKHGLIFVSLFHSVSAFCNAGFSLFKNSLEDYTDVLQVNITVMLLIIFGGLGFVVLQDGKRKIFGENRRLTLHTKIVLLMTGTLIIFGALFFYIFEYNTSLKGLSQGGKILASFFQSVTTRTAGFDSVSQNSLSVPSKVLTLPLMFVGGSSGSIAGGVKVTTFFIIIIVTLHGTDSKGEVKLFNQKISAENLSRAQNFAIKAIIILFASIFLLTITELHHFGRNAAFQEGKEFLSIVFESFSAFGTVGLSLGLTPNLSPAGKIVIMMTMFAGRVGLISIAMPRIRKYSEYLVDYPRGEVLIG
ncbi:MAG: potassium transporter [Spirochaetales bacterium]|nr:potassium transporter [Spirochaetales bacterium]